MDFTTKSFERTLVLHAVVRQHLQRDMVVELQIDSLVDLAHSAAGDEAHDTKAFGQHFARTEHASG